MARASLPVRIKKMDGHEASFVVVLASSGLNDALSLFDEVSLTHFSFNIFNSNLEMQAAEIGLRFECELIEQTISHDKSSHILTALSRSSILSTFFSELLAMFDQLSIVCSSMRPLDSSDITGPCAIEFRLSIPPEAMDRLKNWALTAGSSFGADVTIQELSVFQSHKRLFIFGKDCL